MAVAYPQLSSLLAGTHFFPSVRYCLLSICISCLDMSVSSKYIHFVSFFDVACMYSGLYFFYYLHKFQLRRSHRRLFLHKSQRYRKNIARYKYIDIGYRYRYGYRYRLDIDKYTHIIFFPKSDLWFSKTVSAKARKRSCFETSLLQLTLFVCRKLAWLVTGRY